MAGHSPAGCGPRGRAPTLFPSPRSRGEQPVREARPSRQAGRHLQDAAGQRRLYGPVADLSGSLLSGGEGYGRPQRLILPCEAGRDNAKRGGGVGAFSHFSQCTRVKVSRGPGRGSAHHSQPHCSRAKGCSISLWATVSRSLNR